MKLLLIGFDALSPQILFPWRDKLPAIDALCRRGMWGNLESYCEVPSAGPAWTTIYTGLLPEEHGVTHEHGRPRRGSKTFATCEAKYIWDVLAEEGFTVGLFNLPITYPPRPIPREPFSNGSREEDERMGCNNWMVSGFPAPDPAKHAIAWPESLQCELVAEGDSVKRYFSDPIEFFSRNILGLNEPIVKTCRRIALDSGEELVSEVVETVSRHQLQVCLRVFKNHPVDVGFCQFSFLDRIAHLWGFYSHLKEPDRWYKLVDEFVGALVEQENSENVIIVSDHGFKGEVHLRNGVVIMSGQCFCRQQQVSVRIQDVPAMIKKSLGLEYATTADDEIASQLRALGYIK